MAAKFTDLEIHLGNPVESLYPGSKRYIERETYSAITVLSNLWNNYPMGTKPEYQRYVLQEVINHIGGTNLLELFFDVVRVLNGSVQSVDPGQVKYLQARIQQLERERQTERGPGIKLEQPMQTVDIGAYYED